MKYCSLVAIACLAVALIAGSALAAAKAPSNSKLPVRPVKHVRSAATVVHDGDCGCSASSFVEISPSTCGASCASSGATCGCDDCDPGLLSLIFDDMCDAVDSLFNCNGCRSSCGDGAVWDSCESCNDSKPCRSRRSPKRRPKCDSCSDCSSLWDGFCADSCASGCESSAGGSTHIHGHSGHMHGQSMEIYAAPPVELKDVPPPTPAGQNKAASRLKNSRSVLRSPTPASPSPIRRTAVELDTAPTALPPAKPLRAKAKPSKPQASHSKPAQTKPSKAPVLNAPQVNRATNRATIATLARSDSEVRPVAAVAPADEVELEPAEPTRSAASPVLPANPLRSSR
jgi:hypothetical protein